MGSMDVLKCALLLAFCCSCSCSHRYPDALCLDYEANTIYPGQVYFDGCNHCVCGDFGRAVTCIRDISGQVRQRSPMSVSPFRVTGGFVPPDRSIPREHQRSLPRTSTINWSSDPFRNIRTSNLVRYNGSPPTRPQVKSRLVALTRRPFFTERDQTVRGQSMTQTFNNQMLTQMVNSQRMVPNFSDRNMIPAIRDRTVIPTDRDQYMIPAVMYQHLNLAVRDRSMIPSVRDRSMIPSVRDRSMIPSVRDRSMIPSVRDRSMIPSVRDRSMIPSVRDRSMLPSVRDRIMIPSVRDRSMIPSVGDQSMIPSVRDQSVIPSVRDRSMIPSVRDGNIIPTVRGRTLIPISIDGSVTPNFSDQSSGSQSQIDRHPRVTQTLDSTATSVAENLHAHPQSLARTEIKLSGISPRIM